MKKILPYILMTVIVLANVLAPFSVGWEDKANRPTVVKNYAEAGWILDGKGDNPIKIEIDAGSKDKSIKVSVKVSWSNKTILSTQSVYVMLRGKEQENPSEITYAQVEKVRNLSYSEDGIGVGFVEFDDLEPLTTYEFDVRGTQNSTNIIQSSINLLNRIFYTIIPISSSDEYLLANTGEVQNKNPYIIKTQPETPEGYTNFINENGENNILENNASLNSRMPACNILNKNGGTFTGCIAVSIYKIIFVPTSYLFALAGTFFDNTFAYSINSESYKSAFVVQGWKLVRDFCNMFFIFILLYIAFGTILGLSGFNTKKMIINVIIIGLLINFSLFAARVIIDTSNILARVFYNSNTIQITELSSGNAARIITNDQQEAEGVIPLSAALVNKVNPQTLIMNAGSIDDIEVQGNTNAASGDQAKDSVTTGTFILVTLLAIGINVIGFIVFLSVGLLFVTRVIGLWLAMILAPLAFLSYTVPAMQNLEMIGWKKWWAETIKLAFLAPVFIFFLYLILQFLNTGLDIISTDNKKGLDLVISILIPFAFIMVLLWKAKDIAKSMSGKIGQAVSNAGAKAGKGAMLLAGGAAVGAVAGGAAALGRSTVGRAGSAITNSSKLKAREAKGGIKGWGARQLRNVGNFAGSGSMDLRGVKIAGKGISDTGLKVGNSKAGGFEKMKSDSIMSKQKKAKELEVGPNEALKRNLNKEENNLQGMLQASSNNLETLNSQIKTARERSSDADKVLKADPGNIAKQTDAQVAAQEVLDLRQLKKEIREMRGASAPMATTVAAAADAAVTATTTAVESAAHTALVKAAKEANMFADAANASAANGNRSINDLEYMMIPEAKNKVTIESSSRKRNYADSISKKSNKVWSTIFSGGQYSHAGANEAAHKIRMDIKIEDK